MNSLQEEVLDTKPLRELNCEIVEQRGRNGEPLYVMKNKNNSTYLRLNQTLFNFFNLMDGKTAIRDIVKKLFDSEEAVNLDYIFQFLSALHKKEMMLVESDKDKTILQKCFDSPSKSPASWSFLSKIGGKFIKTKIGFKGADKYITRLYNIGGKFLFTKISIFGISLISLIGIILFAVQLKGIHLSIKELLAVNGSYFLGISILYLGASIVTVLHESAHALSCKYFGREVNSMGIMLYYGSIAFFTDVTDTWMLPREKRIIVGAAGVIASLFIGAILSIIAFLYPSTLIRALCLKGALLNFSEIFFNLIPFLKYDGYYIISDLFDIPNLRQESLALVLSASSWKRVLKGRLPDRGKGGVFVFGLSSFMYSVLALYIGLTAVFSLTYNNLPQPYNIYLAYFAVLVIVFSTISLTVGRIRSSLKSSLVHRV
jgi:putative peptide zinc metalloprotease protein